MEIEVTHASRLTRAVWSEICTIWVLNQLSEERNADDHSAVAEPSTTATAGSNRARYTFRGTHYTHFHRRGPDSITVLKPTHCYLVRRNSSSHARKLEERKMGKSVNPSLEVSSRRQFKLACPTQASTSERDNQ